MSFGKKLWTGLGILQVRLRFILLLVIVGLLAGNWDRIMDQYDRWTRPAKAPAVAVEYTCTMHPGVSMSQPGNCPICGMPLVERSALAGKTALPSGVLGRVQLTPQKMMMGRIGTSLVEYRLLARQARTVGTIGYDETRRRTISARIKGRLDELFVNFVGQKVDKGDPLASIYSPELLVAQEELLSAARSVEQQKAAGGPMLAVAQTVLDAARSKLLLWGFADKQVADLIESKKPQTHMTIYAPIGGFVTEKKALQGRYVAEGEELYTLADLSNVWLQARIFPADLGDIRDANESAVEVSTTAYPNEPFAGRITFVAFTVDPGTQTVDARVEVKNPDYRLRVGMVVGAVIHQAVGKVEPASAATQPGLAASSKAATATASAPSPAAPTEALLRAYLALLDAYTQDRADANALAALAREAEALSPSLPQAGDAARQVRQMEAMDLRQQRKALQQLSQTLIAVLRQSSPRGVDLYLMHCPMDRGGDWVALTKEIRNPYYGSEMPNCGDPPVPLRPAGVESPRFAEGYYCPVFPDRLFDAPQHCPVDDKFPTKYMRVQKVLAVPASAVIDTGMRKVVYRETDPNANPGVFDMVEVKLGVIAGEYYPVVDGLKDGDRVATAGAFLVDAENRLNPAVAAQYFGATGAGQTPPAPAPAGAVHQH